MPRQTIAVMVIETLYGIGECKNHKRIQALLGIHNCDDPIERASALKRRLVVEMQIHDSRKREDGRDVVGIKISFRMVKKVWNWIKKKAERRKRK